MQKTLEYSIEELEKPALEVLELIKNNTYNKLNQESDISYSIHEGLVYNTLWELIHADKYEDGILDSESKLQLHLIGYINDQGALTDSGREMRNRLQPWYLFSDECD